MFREELYMLTQVELIEFVEMELRSKRISYKKDDKGNIWSFKKTGPTLVSHMDTVLKSDAHYKEPLEIANVIIDAGWSKKVVHRPDYILGADDRAGVNVILNYADTVNFVLTVDEEIGCIGAKALAKNDVFIKDCKENVTFFIEIDRKGKDEFLGNTHGYCNKDLSDKIKSRLPELSDGRGVLTDIDHFTGGIAQGINLACGYYNAHSNKEYLVLDEWQHVNDFIIPELLKVKIKRTTHEKQRTFYSGRTYGGWAGYDDWYNGGTGYYSAGNREKRIRKQRLMSYSINRVKLTKSDIEFKENIEMEGHIVLAMNLETGKHEWIDEYDTVVNLEHGLVLSTTELDLRKSNKEYQVSADLVNKEYTQKRKRFVELANMKNKFTQKEFSEFEKFIIEFGE